MLWSINYGNVLLEHILYSLNVEILYIYLLLLAEDDKGNIANSQQ